MKKSGLRSIAAAVVAGGLALAAFSCTSGSEKQGSQEVPTLRVATLVWVGYAPIHLAIEKGFFRQHGLEVELRDIEDTAARRAALSSGSVDASVDIVDSFANAAAAGLPARVVMKLDDSMGGDGIVVRSDIESVADLAGKTVAYPPGQPSHFFLLAVLEDAGLTIKDIQSKPMEADQAGAAFVSQQVDAAVTWEPWLSRAAALPHGKILTTSREKPGLIVDVLTVRRSVLDERPDDIRAFAEGWFDAIQYWREHPEEANAIMAKALKVKPAVFDKMVHGVRYSDEELNRQFFTRDAAGESAFTRLLARAGRVWQREGVIKTSPDPKVVDGSDVLFGPGSRQAVTPSSQGGKG